MPPFRDHERTRSRWRSMPVLIGCGSARGVHGGAVGGGASRAGAGAVAGHDGGAAVGDAAGFGRGAAESWVVNCAPTRPGSFLLPLDRSGHNVWAEHPILLATEAAGRPTARAAPGRPWRPCDAPAGAACRGSPDGTPTDTPSARRSPTPACGAPARAGRGHRHPAPCRDPPSARRTRRVP